MSDLIKSRETAEPRSCCFIGKAPALAGIVSVRNQQAGQDGRELVSTLYIFHRGDAYPSLERLTARRPYGALRSVIARLNSFHQDRMNPRSLAYMKELIRTEIGSPEVTEAKDLSILSHLNGKGSGLQQAVLLWPDGNGMGWYNIERQVFNAKNARIPVFVLNGRRRMFELPRTLWQGCRFRRFLEKSFLLEIGVLIVFFATAPALTLWDFIFEPKRR